MSYASELFARGTRPVLVWLAHCTLVFLLFAEIAGVHAVQTFCRGPEAKLFDMLPAEWPFHLLDGLVVIGVGLLGVIASIESYVSHKKDAWSKFLKTLGLRCGLAGLEWTVHSVAIALILLIVHRLAWAMEKYHLTFQFFSKIPVGWTLDGAELLVILGLGVLGGYKAVKIYRGVGYAQ